MSYFVCVNHPASLKSSGGFGYEETPNFKTMIITSLLSYKQMKKLSAILLISIYAVATMGFNMKEFYCCGKLKKVTIAVVTQKDKCTKGDNKSEGCCNNKYHYFKVKDNHVSAVTTEFTAAHFTHLHTFSTCFHNNIYSSQKTVIAYKSNAPPFHRSVPVYIANCVYRI